MGEKTYEGLLGMAKLKTKIAKDGLKYMIEEDKKKFKEKQFPLEWAMYLLGAQITLNQGLILINMFGTSWFPFSQMGLIRKAFFILSIIMSGVSLLTLIQLGRESRKMH